MSNQYPVYESPELNITLEESSGKFQVCCHLPGVESYDTEKMDEEEVLELVVKLLGPLYYFNPGATYLDEIAEMLNAKGYT